MPINLRTSDGEFTPYLKYNAKAGRFYIRPESSTQDVEVEKPRLYFDMAHVKTGWLYYSEGAGPEKVWDPSPSHEAPRPAGPRKFKRGFEVNVFGADELPGIGKLNLREFSSTANNVIGAFLRMHADYEKGMTANPGKVPFYKCSRVIPIQGAYGTNYEPEFQLIGWTERSKIPAFDAAMDSGPVHSNGHANGHDQHVDPRDEYPDAGRTGISMPSARVVGAGPDLNDEIPFNLEWR